MANTAQSELAAIREAAAFAPLPGRAFLRISGADSARWLNGMVTNAIQPLAPGQGNYNFLLNAQGRIQGDCTIYRQPIAEPAEFLLETDSSQLDTIQQHLDHFIIMDDVELTPAYSRQKALLIIGPKAPDILTLLGYPTLDPLRLAHVETEHGNDVLLTPTAGSVPQYELRTRANYDVVGVPEVSAEVIEMFRILEGRPKFGQDIRNSETARDLPQETAQNHALHFSKGCYLGQEIVERIHSRGQVHRTFTQFRLTGSLPALPAPLQAAGKAVGELTSAALIPLPEGDSDLAGPTLLALGYARREALDLHQPLTYPGGSAEPFTASKH